jgi:hypothetical protein
MMHKTDNYEICRGDTEAKQTDFGTRRWMNVLVQNKIYYDEDGMSCSGVQWYVL